MFENRETYRKQHQKQGLVSFDITVKETNLNIQAATDLSQEAVRAVLQCRQYIESHILAHPEFATSLAPLPHPQLAPPIIREMTQAGQAANVGPMAAVAGAVAEYTGRHLLTFSPEVVVENGGDIFIKSDTGTTFTIFAGDSPFSLTTGIQVAKRPEPFALCTSSGTLGHSKSFGRADAVTVLADSCALADAAATDLANQIQTPEDIQPAIDIGQSIPGIQGLVMILGKHIGLWGGLKLVRLPGPT